ncbi:glycine/D-amino acid oxidase-like deaminating enzyme [Aquimarina sp. MAR_2010_214]|uniref:NAD(P)/FAD-dependent oxidoreductase n=1 Tax=Aquimarina sp. MAR_2010_214 TaxID=1250026 RepID=UPI000C70F693|nr:FAD-dependent oxidoreductase [Aquimarina sp. MAR_2010_214]PKV48103.1 glycine/D-amino acid oxidase-like deaminating enzyme [Aquimarina sp. MAR_2010_214]
MLDYIVVGFGISGLSFVEQLESNNKSYKVYEDASQKSSRVAGGIFNPVVLKRFTMAWQASEQIDTAISLYKNVEAKLHEPLISELPVLRRFNAVEEQNNWFEACDKPILCKFLSSELIRNTNAALDIPFQYGKVNYTGKIELNTMLSSYEKRLKEHDFLLNESFEYDKLIIEEECIRYKGVQSKHIVFAEGFGVKNNPFFNDLPLYGNKGEYIIIKSEALKLQETIKSSIFIIPLGDDLYKVGATYNNQDKSPEVTVTAREELQKKLEKFLKVPYEVVDQVAGIRPTVKDRRPLIGTHTRYANMHILNGMGSRGILLAPTMAKELYNHIEKGISLDKEIDCKRYESLR